MECLLAMKKNKIGTFAATWMELVFITQSKINQVQDGKRLTISHVEFKKLILAAGEMAWRLSAVKAFPVKLDSVLNTHMVIQNYL